MPCIVRALRFIGLRTAFGFELKPLAVESFQFEAWKQLLLAELQTPARRLSLFTS
jgi:hypothetical protein